MQYPSNADGRYLCSESGGMACYRWFRPFLSSDLQPGGVLHLRGCQHMRDRRARHQQGVCVPAANRPESPAPDPYRDIRPSMAGG